MKLSTGKVAFPIEFDNGDKAFIYINPNDRGIQERIQEFEASIKKKIKQIDFEKYNSRFDGNIPEIDFENPQKLLEMSAGDLKELQEKMQVINQIEGEYNRAIKDELDVVFNSKISDVAFRYCQPFDFVIIEDEQGNDKRELYILHFMHWLMVELQKYNAKNKSAMDKHLGKYNK